MEEEELFYFLDKISMQMKAGEKKFYEYWNSKIGQFFCIDSFSIQSHSSVFGGFTLSETEFAGLNTEFSRFFHSRAQKDADNQFVLRGFDYYECDPSIHILKSEQINDILRSSFSKKWDKYSEVIVTNLKNDFNVVNWLALLSFLEYIFNDLSSIEWFILKNKEYIPKSLKILNYIENCIEDIAYLIANFLDLRLDDTIWNTLENILIPVIESRIIKNFFKELANWDFMFIQGSIRAIREGDSLVLIYSAYYSKLSKFTEQCSSISFISNAFGGFNIGAIFKHLTLMQLNANSYNLQYSQYRSTNLFETKSDGVQILSLNFPQEFHDVIIVDDCIFTGKSFEELTKKLLGMGAKKISLLPLALDVQSLKYYQRGSRNVEKVYMKAKMVKGYAQEIGKTLPDFQAFWDWTSDEKEYLQENNKKFKEVMFGGDMLLRELFTRYQIEILKEIEADGN